MSTTKKNQGAAAPQTDPDCEHDNVIQTGVNEQQCLDCGVGFIYCDACSHDGSVYHTPPACKPRAERPP